MSGEGQIFQSPQPKEFPEYSVVWRPPAQRESALPDPGEFVEGTIIEFYSWMNFRYNGYWYRTTVEGAVGAYPAWGRVRWYHRSLRKKILDRKTRMVLR